MLRSISIEPVLNGFIINIGCQKVVFNKLDELIVELNDYYLHPDIVEERFLKNAVNKTMDNPAQAAYLRTTDRGEGLGPSVPTPYPHNHPSYDNQCGGTSSAPLTTDGF